MFEHYYTLTLLQKARHQDMLRRLEQRQIAQIAREGDARISGRRLTFHPVDYVIQSLMILRSLRRGFKVRARSFSGA